MKKSNIVRVILKVSEDKNIYLAKISQSDDGSVIIAALPSINSGHKAARLKYDFKELVVENENTINTGQNKKRISYHTSGIVKYHGFDFEKRQYEPLYAIKKKNVFLSLFLSLHNRIPNKVLKEDENYFIIDVSGGDQGVLISFSIEPIESAEQMQKEKFFKICFNLFALTIYFEYDDLIKKYMERENKTFGYFSLDNGVPVNESPDIKYLSEIAYKKIIYKQKDVFVREINDTTFEMVFSVPMRCPPKFRIELENPEHKAFLAKMGDCDVSQAHLRFCVRDQKGKKLTAELFQITKIENDAEIY